MSYYVVVEDMNKEEVDFLCGWTWSEFGNALGNRGKELSEYKYELTLSALDDLFAAANAVAADKRYAKLLGYSKVAEGMYEAFLYDYLLGMEEYDVDMEKYNDIRDVEVAYAVRKADLEYAERKRAEAQERRYNTLLWFNEAASLVKGELHYAFANKLNDENVVAMIEFILEVERYANKVGKDSKVLLFLG